MMTIKTRYGFLSVTPAAGRTFEEIKEHVRLAGSRGYRCSDDGCYACRKFPTAGPTARWIKPSRSTPGAVICPTCESVVKLATWWSHGCRAVASPDASNEIRPARKPARKVWIGDIPTTCNRCPVPIRNGFAR
jgi:hypothetical protein